MNIKGFLTLALSVLLIAGVMPVGAANPNDTVVTSKPASSEVIPGADQILEAMVTGVRGLVQVRGADDQPWQKATIGMKITQGASFRTGLRSAVQFKIQPDQTVTLDRLGTITLLRAVAEAGKIKTDLGMKYGRTRYDIRKAGFEHESTIRSPSATLSVRGTRVGIQDGASGFVAWCTESRAYLTDQSSRRNLTFGDRGQVHEGSEHVAGESKRRGTIDPGDDRSRQGPERLLLTERPGGDFNPGRGQGRFGLPRLPLPPRGFLPKSRLVEGSLRFELIWQSPYFSTDLDLYVISPSYTGDNPISVAVGTVPGDALTAPSGGHVNSQFGDDTDGSRPMTGPAAFGREVIEWEGKFPTGRFKVGVLPFDLDGKSSQPYHIHVNAKAPGQQEFATIQHIDGTAIDGVTHEHDVVVGVNLPPQGDH